jgi:hypothetical protein
MVLIKTILSYLFSSVSRALKKAFAGGSRGFFASRKYPEKAGQKLGKME